MNDLAIARGIAPMSDQAIEAVRKLETEAMAKPQTPIATDHVLHGGMYARTIVIPAGVTLTGALIKIATILILNGDAIAYMERPDRKGGGAVRLTGYHVLPASARRKQAFVAQLDTYLTMIFPTGTKTVAEAEAEFTDEANLLFSRNVGAENHIIITGQ